MNRKAVWIVLLVIGVGVLSSCEYLAPWLRSIPESRLRGEWKNVNTADGPVVLKLVKSNYSLDAYNDNVIDHQGTFKVVNDQVWFSGSEDAESKLCLHEGIYGYEFGKGGFRLEMVADACPSRIKLLQNEWTPSR